jgi:hypothetical protein
LLAQLHRYGREIFAPMKPWIIASAVLASAALISPVLAETLDGPAIRKLVTGRTIYLAAPLGGEFPLNYRPDGTVNGDGTSVGLGRFLAAKETGRWSVDGNLLCQQFPTWNKGAKVCFTLERLADGRIRWVQTNGDQGLARLGN